MPQRQCKIKSDKLVESFSSFATIWQFSFIYFYLNSNQRNYISFLWQCQLFKDFNSKVQPSSCRDEINDKKQK